MENNQTQQETSSLASKLLAIAIAAVMVGVIGYLYYISMHSLSMMMLGNMQVGYENFLYQHMHLQP